MPIRIKTQMSNKIIDTIDNECLRTAQTVWLAKTVPCQRYTFRGVRTRDLDCIFDESIIVDRDVIVEFSVRPGRYADGHYRLAIRRYNNAYAHQVNEGTLTLARVGRTFTLSISSPYNYRKIPFNCVDEVLHSDTNYEHMLTTHAYGDGTKGGYFRHLNADDVDSIANEFAAWCLQNPDLTKIEAYREAGRLLYRTSRELGWRKLSLRERQKFGITDEVQWHRVDTLNTRIYARTEVL